MQTIESVKVIDLPQPFYLKEVPEEFLREGLSDKYSKPLEDGGSLISRHLMNLLGDIASLQLFFVRIGMFHEYKEEVNTQIGYGEYSTLHELNNHYKVLRTKTLQKSEWKYSDNIDLPKFFIGDYEIGQMP